MAVVLVPELLNRIDGASVRPLWVWQPAEPVLAISSAVAGGGIGPRRWVLNATVSADYAGGDPAADIRTLAAALAIEGDGIGLLTAVDVRETVTAADTGVEVLATVGVSWPTWAAAADEPAGPRPAGTINLVVWVPARLSDAALVNAAGTLAEAKAQALVELGVPGTGTASDAFAICCPRSGPSEPYGGPRSTWGRVSAGPCTAPSGPASPSTARRDRSACFGARRCRSPRWLRPLRDLGQPRHLDPTEQPRQPAIGRERGRRRRQSGEPHGLARRPCHLAPTQVAPDIAG